MRLAILLPKTSNIACRMRTLFILCVCALLGGAVFVSMKQEPIDQTQVLAEIDYIFAQNTQHFVEADNELRREITESVRLQTEELGAIFVDPDQFDEEFTHGLSNEYDLALKDVHRTAYLKLFTSEEIVALAAFYRSEAGQKFLSGDRQDPEFAEVAALYMDGPGAPVLANLDELLSRIEKPIEEQTARIQQMFSMARMADFIERRDLIHFEDESRRKAIAEGLRKRN